MEAEQRRLDVLTIGEVVVDFISAEKTDTLSNASTFALSKDPQRLAVHRAMRVEGHVERMIDREQIYAGLHDAGQRTM